MNTSPITVATLASLSFDTSQILVYLVLAIACTAAGWLYVKTFYGLQRLFGRLSAVPKAVRPAIGGLLLGIIEALGAGYIGDLTGGFLGSHYQDIFAFVVLILVLTLRPSGIMGERVADRA